MQVSGTHYQAPIQCWDYIIANDLNYLEGNVIKYVTRHRKKNGMVDLEKAHHYLTKLIEVERAALKKKKVKTKVDKAYRKVGHDKPGHRIRATVSVGYGRRTILSR